MKTVDYYMSLPYRLEIIPDTVEGGFTAYYPELPGCITSSRSFDTIYTNAQDAKQEWLNAALEEGLEINEPDSNDIARYSGQFKIRMPRTLHRQLAINAREEGISMNQYCVYLLSRNNANAVKSID